MLNSGYTFEKYSVALPYKDVDDIKKTGLVANEARALLASTHGSEPCEALASQNNRKMINLVFCARSLFSVSLGMRYKTEILILMLHAETVISALRAGSATELLSAIVDLRSLVLFI